MSRFEEARNKSIVDILNHYGVNISKNGYFTCPFCGHNDTAINYKTNKFTCFHSSCGARGSAIDFVSKIEGINDIEAVNKILDNSLSIKKYNPIIAIEKKNKNDVLKNMTLKNSKPIGAEGFKYFKDRGIERALSLVNPKQLEIKFNEYNGYKSIIYRFMKQDFIIQKSITKNADGKRFVRNLGSTAPVPIKSYKHNKYMIVEGIEDGLTALILGYNFITLNSVQNVGHLMELLEQNETWSKSNIFYECLDNDNAGNECKDKLKAFFSSKGLNLKVSDYKKLMIEYKVKDINELYLFLKKERSGVNIAHT